MRMVLEKTIGNISFRLAEGDITVCGAEAIVNAANRKLEHGGGVAYAIAKACAGSAEEYTRISKKAMKEQTGRDHIEHGEVVVTPAIRLEERGTKYVIHTVGPVCSGKWNEELERKLYLAFSGVLDRAEELGIKSVAFPALSAGIYGCPLKNVVKTLLKALDDFSRKAKNLEDVMLVIYDSESVEIARKVIDESV